MSYEESEKLDWIKKTSRKYLPFGEKIVKISPVVTEIALLRVKTRGSAIAEGLRDTLVSRNSATTKYRYCVALFA